MPAAWGFRAEGRKAHTPLQILLSASCAFFMAPIIGDASLRMTPSAYAPHEIRCPFKSPGQAKRTRDERRTIPGYGLWTCPGDDTSKPDVRDSPKPRHGPDNDFIPRRRPVDACPCGQSAAACGM